MFRRLRERIAEEANRLPAAQIAFGNNSRPLDMANRINESSEDLITLSDSSAVIDPHPTSQHFSIAGDEDAPLSEQNTPQKKMANSSGEKTGAAFKEQLPVINNNSAYIPQTDIESEVDDPPTLNLDGISKDQLLTSIQLLKARLCKYKNKYAEVVKSYKIANEEKKKIEHALTDNQDKSLRRIAELREQCHLEQKAKAHLEENLRLILEEKESRISVLETQINLLKEGQSEGYNEQALGTNELTDSSEAVISSRIDEQDKVDQMSELLKEYEVIVSSQKDQISKLTETEESLRVQLSDMQKSAEELKSKEAKFRLEQEELVSNLKIQLMKLQEQQEDNVMSMAETKKNMHEELELKERQLNELKDEARQLQVALDQEKGMIVSMTRQQEEKSKELMNQLRNMEKAMEEEKENLIREFSRGKAEAVALIQLESSNKQASLEQQWKAELDKQQAEKEIALQEKDLQLQHKIQELQSLQEKINNIETEMKLKEEKHTSSVEVSTQVDNLQTQEMQSLEKCPDDHLEDVEKKWEREIKLLEDKVSELVEQNFQLKQEMEDIVSALEQEMKAKLDKQNSELLSELKVKNAEVEALQISLSESKKELEQCQEKLIKEIECSKNLATHLENEIAVLNASNALEMENLHKKLHQLERERELLMIEAQERVADTEMKYRKEVEQLSAKVQELQLKDEEIMKLKNENNLLNSQLDESLLVGAANQSQASEQVSLLNNQLEELRHEVFNKEKKLSDMETELKSIAIELQEKNTSLEHEGQKICELNKELSKMQEDLEKQTNCIEALQKELSALSLENDQMKTEIATLKQEEESLESRYQSLELSKVELNDAFKQLQSENETLRTSCRCLTCGCEKLRLLQDENAELSSKIQAYECPESGPCSNCESLKCDIDHLQKEYEKKLTQKDDEIEQKLKIAMKEITEQMNMENQNCGQAVAELVEKNQVIEDQLLREHRLEIAALRQDIFEKDCALEEMHEHYEAILKDKETKMADYRSKLSNLQESLNKNTAGSDAEIPVSNDVSDWDDTWVVPEESCDQIPPPSNKLDCDAHIQQIESMQKELTKCNSELKDLRVLLRLSTPTQPPHLDNNCSSLNHVPEATEFEYLRNILFEYMMGKETETLVKVIAAVLRFSEEQTHMIIEREKTKQPAR